MRVNPRWLFAVAVLGAPAAAQAAPVPAVPAKADNPMAAVRKALDEVGDMNYQGRTLLDVITDLKEKSKVPVVLDNSIANFGLDVNQPNVTVNLKQVKLKDGLKAVLEPFNLKFGLTREGLYISTEEGLTSRQLRQRVSVDCDGTEFAAAVKQLATDTGANVVIDPRLADKAKKPITLKLDDVPLETAVLLMSAVADLGAMRTNNVLFITTPDKVEKTRLGGDGPTTPGQVNPGFFPNVPPGIGGFGGVQVLPGVAPAVPPVEAPPEPAPQPEKPAEKK